MASSDPRRTEGGWALLSMLLAVALLSLGSVVVATSMRIEREREREAELLRVGAEIVDAIAAYRASPFATAPELPAELAQLLDDRRGPRPLRHLRRIPRDPATGRAEWGLLREGDRIAGVHSLSTRPPLRKRNFPPRFAAFAQAPRLADWRFTVVPGTAPRPAAPLPAAFPSGAATAAPGSPFTEPSKP